ncbi:MAG TPA: GvpL/GvpF family gas vesicle protein [Nocardioides sp.]|nr:GvpL/GvpF family gas vesicle protein [Nocardioides sp.]
MIILYAVTWRDGVPPLDEGAELVEEGELAMVVGPAPTATSREDALAFGRTIERLAAAVDVLPFRYGTTVADADEAGALLREHGSGWAARLQKVEGCAELALRATPPPSHDQERAESGTAHLNRLVSRSRHLDAVEGEVADLLTGRCRVVRRLAGHEELRLSFLVERPSVEPVRSALQEWATRRDDLVVSVTGPWAPYSFAADGEDSGVAL